MQRIELTAEQLQQIERMSGLGMTKGRIALVLGMSAATLFRKFAENEGDNEAIRAYERGKADAIDKVSQAAFDMAVSKKEPGMTQFWLQCRAGWKKTEGRELSTKKNRPLETHELTEEELKQRVEENNKSLRELGIIP